MLPYMTHPQFPAMHPVAGDGEGAAPVRTFGPNAGPTAPDYERIYLEPGNGDPDNGRLWCRDDVWTGDEDYEGMEATAYVRADLALTDAVRLVEENLRLREALRVVHVRFKRWAPRKANDWFAEDFAADSSAVRALALTPRPSSRAAMGEGDEPRRDAYDAGGG